MDLDTYDDYDRYDNTVDDLTDEEAIEELVAEGYTEEEAIRMIGEQDSDDFYGLNDESDDLPDYADYCDDEDFE